MPNSSPAWVRQVQVTVIVDNAPVPEQPSTEFALDTYGYVSTSSSTLQTLFSRTVPSAKIGVLDEIELSCDNYDVASWEIIVKGVTILDSETIPESFTKAFPSLHLEADESITVKVKSNGSATIKAWSDVSYKEVG